MSFLRRVIKNMFHNQGKIMLTENYLVTFVFTLINLKLITFPSICVITLLHFNFFINNQTAEY